MSDDPTTTTRDNQGLGEMSGLVQQAADGGFVWKVPGFSENFGWKLSDNGSGLLWTDDSYAVLENCVGLSFEDRDVSPSDLPSRMSVDAPELAFFDDVGCKGRYPRVKRRLIIV